MATVEIKPEPVTVCPACGTRGKKVPPETVPALVKPDLQSAVRAQPYRFCDTPRCDVVYFSEVAQQQQFKRADIRVRVGQKETEQPIQVCYCFDWTADDIEQEMLRTGRTRIPDRIRRKVQEGFCQCETMNPQGSCCLGNVSKAVKEAEHKLHSSSGRESQPGCDTDSRARPSLSSAVKAGARVRRVRERGALFATAGAVFSAVVASACCWLPLVLLAIGISGVGVASIFEQYRPIFLTGAFALLGLAWYLTVLPNVRRWLARSPVAASGFVARATHACCVPESEELQADAAESCCATAEGRRRFTMRHFNVGMLLVATVVVFVFAFFPHSIGFVLRGGKGTAPSAAVMNRYEFRIEGMTCEGCAATLEKAIRRVPDIRQVHVSNRDGLATIGIEPGKEFDTAGVLSAIENAGYRGSLADGKGSATP